MVPAASAMMGPNLLCRGVVVEAVICLPMFSDYRRAAPRRSPSRRSHGAALRSGQDLLVALRGRRGHFLRKGWHPDTLMGGVASSLESAVKPSGGPWASATRRAIRGWCEGLRQCGGLIATG